MTPAVLRAGRGPVVTFGETLLRLSPPGAERLLQSPALHAHVGGAETNVAVGLAQLGTAAAHVTRLPDGPLGDAALQAIRAHGVDVRHVHRAPGRLGLYFLEPGADLRPLRTVYDRAGSAFALLDPRAFDWPAILDGAGWLHLTGITVALGDGPARAAHDAAAAARRLGVPVSVDLNFRPALWAGRTPEPLVAPLVDGCTALLANPGAVAAMLGLATDGTPPEPADALARTAERLHARLGCRWVALTQREVRTAGEHAWRAWLRDACDGTGTLHGSRARLVRVVDRVGGGDAFAAGLVHALLAGEPAPAAVEFAAAAGALKLTIAGDVNRVTAEEVARAAAH